MRTVVVGVGNTLMRDDGVGVHVARELMQTDLPEGVDTIDAGTSADAAYELASADRVLVIDAARLGGSPGTIYRLTAEEAMEAGEGVRSCHDMGLIQTLRTISGEGRLPEVEIYGVEPLEIDWGIGLSKEVEASVPRIVEIVRQELKGSQCS